MPIGLWNLRRWRPSGQAPQDDGVILHLSSGTFTRSTSGSYYSGSEEVVRWAVPNELRYENRGDGYGYLALFEGSRTNSNILSEDMGAGNWLAAGGTKYNETVETPQGEVRNLSTLSGTGTATRLQYTIAVNQNTSGSLTAWARTSGTIAEPMNVRIGMVGKDSVTRDSDDIPITSNWKRIENTDTFGSGGLNGLLRAALHSSSIGGPSEWITYMVQTELNTAFPSTYISTSNATATRGVDILSFDYGTYPLALIGSGSFQFDVYPYFASSEVGGNTGQLEYNLFGRGDSDVSSLRFIFIAPSTCRIQLVKASSRLIQDVSFSRHQKLTIKMIANDDNTAWVSASLRGFTSGDGDYILTSPTSFSTGTLYVGSRSAVGGSAFFGRISNFFTATLT